MSAWLLGLVGAIYVTVGIGYLRHGRQGMACVFFAYALANLGLIWDALTWQR